MLFALPFCGVGLGTLVAAALSAGRGEWGQAGLLGVFTLTFGGVGMGLLLGAVHAARMARERERRRRAHPDEPWLWRAEWATGRIESSVRKRMATAWVFAGFWNLVTTPVLGAVPKELESGNTAVLLVALFPIVGAGLLVWALRETLRYRKFGISVLELAHLPGVVGRGLGGLLRTNVALAPREGVTVTLTCVRRVVRRSGKNSSTSETILWQGEERLPEVTPDPDGRGSMIRVLFRLPKDVEPSDDSKPENRVIWRLTATAEIPGVDYFAAFEVPVFRTPESEALRDLPVSGKGKTPDPSHQPVDSRISVTTNRRGTEIYFPPARNPGAALGLSMFTIIWFGAIWLTIAFDAPLIFPIVFGVFGVLLVYGTLVLWLGVTRVTIASDRVTVARGLLAPGRPKRLRANAVADVRLKIGMQSGNKAYYDIILVGTDGTKVKAGGTIRHKREAEWLAATMRDALAPAATGR